MYQVRVSKHGYKRIKERMGIPKKATIRQFQRALDQGIYPKQTNGGFQKFLASISLHEEIPHSVVVFNNFVFVYSKEGEDYTLITVLSLPANLQKKVKNIKDKGRY